MFRILTCCLLLGALAPAVNAASAGQPSQITRDQVAFFETLSHLCGGMFEGKKTFPDDPNDSFAGKHLVANIVSCNYKEILIPFSVGKDHSRTWVLKKTPQGLLLKHDHRHPDGTPDDITMYGGWAMANGTANKQYFAADAQTKEMLPEAATNVWMLSIDNDNGVLTYSLSRHNQPRFAAVLKQRKAHKRKRTLMSR